MYCEIVGDVSSSQAGAWGAGRTFAKEALEGPCVQKRWLKLQFASIDGTNLNGR